MRTVMSLTIAVLAVAFVGSPAAAQAGPDGPPRMQGPGMMSGGPAAMARNPVTVVLEHRDELDLTDEQVSTLQQLEARLEEENGPRWEQMREAFGEAAPGELSVEERRALRERMQALAPVREEIRTTNRAVMDEVHELLTDEQETTLEDVMHRDRPGRGARPGMQHRGGGPPGAAFERGFQRGFERGFRAGRRAHRPGR